MVVGEQLFLSRIHLRNSLKNLSKPGFLTIFANRKLQWCSAFRVQLPLAMWLHLFNAVDEDRRSTHGIPGSITLILLVVHEGQNQSWMRLAWTRVFFKGLQLNVAIGVPPVAVKVNSDGIFVRWNETGMILT